MIKICKRKVKYLTSKERRLLSRLRLNTGCIDNHLSWCFKNKTGDVSYAVDVDKNEIVGWALSTPYAINKRQAVMCFVAGRYRRKGIGTRLIEKLNIDNPVVISWDNRSNRFFNKQKNVYHIRNCDSHSELGYVKYFPDREHYDALLSR